MDSEISESLPLQIRDTVQQAVDLFGRCNPLEIISRVAIYILSGNPDIQEPERLDRNETHLEYFISLATALPFPAKAQAPTPDDIQTAIDLVTKIHVLASAYYIFQGSGSSLPIDEIANSFRADRLHVRGDGYWPHLRKTMTDLLSPHDVKLQALLSFSSKNLFEFMERAESALNRRVEADLKTHVEPFHRLMRPWRKYLDPKNESLAPDQSAEFETFLDQNAEAFAAAKAKFDAFGSSELFSISPNTIEEERILKVLSCQFGENIPFQGRGSDDAFWPLTTSITEQRPIIFHDGAFYAFHIPAVLRGTYDLISHLLNESDPGYWKNAFLRARDKYLEDETAKLFRNVLPHANVFQGLHYRVPNESSEPDADVIAICDDVLLVVECKAGSLKPAARRGAPLSVKSGIKETIGKAHSQGSRLINTLIDQGSLFLHSKQDSSQVSLRAEDFRYVVSISVTLDLLNPAATTLWTVQEAGLLENIEKCWSVSLNDLRVIVDILDSPHLFLHYLIRRLDLNALRQVQARDELDYLMHYIERGLFFREQNQPKETEEVTLSGFTGNLDQYYRRVEGLSQLGKRPKPRLGRHTKQILATLEKARPKHYISACLEILEFDIPPREELFSKLGSHLSTLREKTAAFGFSLVGNDISRTALAIATVRGPDFHTDMIQARAIQHCKAHGFEHMCVVLQRVPIGSGAIQVIIVDPNSSPSKNGVRLLNMLRFETKGLRDKRL